MQKVTIGRIISVTEYDEKTVIIRGLFRERAFVVNEDIALQVRGIVPSDFKEGKKIKMIEDENKITIIIEKGTD